MDRVMDNRCIKFKNVIKTLCGYFIKIKFKPCSSQCSNSIVILFLLLNSCINHVYCNRPPRFLIDGQTEIVLRLREGFETPIGSLIYRLKGFDPDGDSLRFGTLPTPGSDVIKIESISPSEANVYLNKELDRESVDEYAIVLTLTDGRLGPGNFITHRMLILVDDINDNAPIFQPFPPSLTLPENAPLGTKIVELTATDIDMGTYGQVIYQLETDNIQQGIFGLETVAEKAILRLTGHLDYEKQTIHQVKVVAIDRAKEGNVNTGTAMVLIKVEDVEDQPPEFISITSVVRIEENSPIGTSVVQVVAVDGDRGINNPIEYSLTSNGLTDISNIFRIQRETGIIFTTNNLDREAYLPESSAYVLQITAREVNSKVVPIPSATTEVTVMITDLNDETPTFKSQHYKCEIAENSPINTPITFLGDSLPEVFDYDQGINGTFELQVKGFGDIFDVTPTKAVNEATFMIRVRNNSLLDYERIKSINLTVTAKEVVQDNPKSSEVSVSVRILDRNDNFPEFTRSVYQVYVPENCEVGTTVAWVQALDDDTGNFGSRGIRYTNIVGSIDYMLNLHPTSGIITVKTSGGPNWDREQVSKHYLTVEARDNLGFGNRNSAQIIVNIEDVNDNPPIFTQNKYEARLLENHLDFDEPLRVIARDADLNGTKNSEIEYSLLGDLSKNFTIDPISGIIRVSQPIDFEELPGSPDETERILHLAVRARDWGNPSLYNDAPLFIYVVDENDNAPVFEESYYNASVTENVVGGTAILQVNAFDFDGSTPNNYVVYRIQSGAADKFVIESETGIISVAKGATLDPDLTVPKKIRYSLIVIALDGAPGDKQLQTSINVDIAIIDINNKPPIIKDPGTVSVVENSPVGTIITTIEAEDPDTSAKLIYKIDANACYAKNERGILLKPQEFDCYASFHLEPLMGILSVAKNIDRELVEKFQIGLVVEDVNSDTGIQVASATIEINIEDVNDNNPKFKEPFYKFSVTENSKFGILIGTVLAEDPDENKTITYSLDSKQELGSLIYLDSDHGDIVVANKIDREENEWLNLTVKATDDGVLPRSSHVEVFIQILDENDNSPYFMVEPKELTIPENIHLGREIAKIQAKDEDSGEYGKVTYLLDRLSSQGKFSIETNTGILKVIDKLDREEKASYLLVIEAWDNYQYGFSSGESRNAFKHLNVTILDVNDNPPILHLPQQCLNITEFHEAGQPISTIHASDADDPETPNGQVIIDIANGNDLKLFELNQINEWSASIKTVSSLRGRHGNYSLLIRAQDLGIPSLQTEESLKICVTDYNDHAPEFISPPYNSTLKIPENATVGSALTQIVAIDEDTGLNGAVRYRLKVDPAAHWKYFELQPVSGILELRLPLNRKKQKIYDIRIEAYDLGVPTSLSSDLDLTIYVSDINDYQPQFMVDEVTLNFTENSTAESEIRKLPDTVDRDEFEYSEHHGPICYFIIGGNDENIFHLNPIDHTLVVTRPLDREVQDRYTILVKATEECSKTPKPQSFFDEDDDTQLKVIIQVSDINDNPPKFVHRVFTGGVSTATTFGTKFMHVKADDKDIGPNAVVSYYQDGKIRMTLTEGLDNLQRSPFLVERETGAIQLNFDPQRGMKGYFDFVVVANDTGGLKDKARVFIYLLREDQRVRFVLRQHPMELRNRIESFREVLGNVTGSIVNVDEFRIHTNSDGTVDKTRTDLYLHLVDRKDNSILEVDEVLRLVDQNTEKLDGLFKEFNVLDTQPGNTLALTSEIQHTATTFWLTVSCLSLVLLLLICLALCINQRQSYHRKLKAATANACVGEESDLGGRGISILSGRVPNTNKHSIEGSNPIWLRAYENEWFNKNTDDYSQSEHDSLDENVLSCENHTPTIEEYSNSHHKCNNLRHQNLYQTLPIPFPRKLETTEL